MQKILWQHPAAPVRVLVLWVPVLKRDNRSSAKNATRYLPDKRAVHFWDTWRFGPKAYARKLECSPSEAWGIFVFHEPGVRWKDPSPPVKLWLQDPRLGKGPPFSREAVESGLLEWIR